MAFTAPDALVRDLLAWVSARPRSYRDTMDAWRTSCPKLPVWEDAVDSGFITVTNEGGQLVVSVTAAGAAWLATTNR